MEPGKPGSTIHSTYPAACNTLAAINAPRRERRSAIAPEGTSARMPTVDQIANSAEMSAPDRPVSEKSKAYSG